MYEGSNLKADNDAELMGALRQGTANSNEALKELASQCPTVTPFWWGIWVMLRVSPKQQPLSDSPLPSVLVSQRLC